MSGLSETLTQAQGRDSVFATFISVPDYHDSFNSSITAMTQIPSTSFIPLLQLTSVRQNLR